MSVHAHDTKKKKRPLKRQRLFTYPPEAIKGGWQWPDPPPLDQGSEVDEVGSEHWTSSGHYDFKVRVLEVRIRADSRHWKKGA